MATTDIELKYKVRRLCLVWICLRKPGSQVEVGKATKAKISPKAKAQDPKAGLRTPLLVRNAFSSGLTRVLSGRGLSSPAPAITVMEVEASSSRRLVTIRRKPLSPHPLCLVAQSMQQNPARSRSRKGCFGWFSFAGIKAYNRFCLIQVDWRTCLRAVPPTYKWKAQEASIFSLQAHESGEYRQVQDSMLYALDGLNSTSSPATQRESASTILDICSTQRGRLAFASVFKYGLRATPPNIITCTVGLTAISRQNAWLMVAVERCKLIRGYLYV